MNRHLKLLVSNTPRSLLQRIAAGSSILPGIGPHCKVQNWVRSTRFIQHAWRKKEYDNNPERALPPRRSTFSDWNYRSELYAFGKRLGEDFDEALLTQAFTDSSHVYAEKQRQEELGLALDSLEAPQDNRELAKWGVNIMKETLTAFVSLEFPKFPNDGVESVVNYLTSQTVMFNLASQFGTKDLIQCSEYPPTEETFATTFAAVVGALEKSSGREKTDQFIIDFVASQLCGKDVNDLWDIPCPWQMLLGITKPLGTTLEPRLLREAGRHTLLSVFVIGIYDQNKKLLGTGTGETIDIAQEMAARDVLKGLFGTRGPIEPFQFQSANYPLKLIPHVRNH